MSELWSWDAIVAEYEGHAGAEIRDVVVEYWNHVESSQGFAVDSPPARETAWARRVVGEVIAVGQVQTALELVRRLAMTTDGPHQQSALDGVVEFLLNTRDDVNLLELAEMRVELPAFRKSLKRLIYIEGMSDTILSWYRSLPEYPGDNTFAALAPANRSLAEILDDYRGKIAELSDVASEEIRVAHIAEWYWRHAEESSLQQPAEGNNLPGAGADEPQYDWIADLAEAVITDGKASEAIQLLQELAAGAESEEHLERIGIRLIEPFLWRSDDVLAAAKRAAQASPPLRRAIAYAWADPKTMSQPMLEWLENIRGE